MLISVSGRLNSGKDEIGKIIQYFTSPCSQQQSKDYRPFELWKQKQTSANLGSFDIKYKSIFEIKKFADSLKDIVCRLINCTREQLEDREFKETSLGDLWKNFTPRQILQKVGTDLFRDGLDENVWVNSLMSKYKFKLEFSGSAYEESGKTEILPNWIITDTRFPNELEAVKKRGGITIRVERPDYLQQNNAGILAPIHASETALDNTTFDYVIENDGTIDELIEKVREILIKENLL